MEKVSDDTCDLIQVSQNNKEFSNNIGTVEENIEDTILSRQTSVNLVPFVGQRFVSQEAAYEFYCSFAKQCGFSIRRDRTRGKDGVGKGITRRDFTCHRGGFPHKITKEESKLHRNRKSSRCGCQAFMRIVKKTGFDVPEWCITCFNNSHNHELLNSNDTSLSPYSSISDDDKGRIFMFAQAGMSVRQMLRLMELEKGLKIGCLPFTEIDVRNQLQSFNNVVRCNYSIDLLKMSKKIKDEDPNFFNYEFKFDMHNRLECISWSSSLSLKLYDTYGDTVIFDTTHHLDAFDMLFGIWVGIDNHGMNCCFGCVLLREETEQSFSWAVKTFLGFMKGKSPQTILTDQNMFLKGVIATEMPTVKHAFSIWQIKAKFSYWFSKFLGPQYDNWRDEFHQLYNMETVEDFERGWTKAANKFNLQTNKHFSNLYAVREYWALPYLRRYFFAGMTTALGPDSINAFIGRFLDTQFQLDHFVEQVFTFFKFQLQSNDRERKQNAPKLYFKTGSPLESHAASILTPYAFSKLQEEFELAPQYTISQMEKGSFLVRHHSQLDGGYTVVWLALEEFISCSCHNYEFSGILCRHVIRVLLSNNCFQIPLAYLPKRWLIECSSSKFSRVTRQKSERIQLLQSMASNLLAESTESEERLKFCCDQMSILLPQIKNSENYGINGITGLFGDSHEIFHRDEDQPNRVEQVFTGWNVNKTRGVFHDPLSVVKIKERRGKDVLDVCRKRKFCHVCCFEQNAQHDAHGCRMMGGGSLDGDVLGFL